MPDYAIFSPHSAFHPIAGSKTTASMATKETQPIKLRREESSDSQLNMQNLKINVPEKLSCIDKVVEQHPPTSITVPHKLHKRAASDPCADRLPPSYQHEALEDLLATLCERHDKFGDAHPKTGSTYNQLGTYHFRHGDYDAAETSYVEALHCYQMAFKTGKSRNREYCRTKGALNIASILNNIGTVCWRTGRLGEATEYLEQTLAIQEGLLERESDKMLIDPIEVGGTLYNLGIVHSLRGCHRVSLRALNRARQMYQEAEAMYGPLLLETSRVVDAIGKIYLLNGQAAKALKHLQDALCMKKRILDSHHPSVLCSISSIADAHKMNGDIDTSIHLYHKVLHAQKVAFDRASSKNESDIIALDISATKKALSDLKYFTKTIPNAVSA